MKAPSNPEQPYSGKPTFLTLRFNALSRGVWHLIDPDAPDVELPKGPRKFPSLEQYTADVNAQARAKFQGDLAAWQVAEGVERRGTAPEASKELRCKDLMTMYEIDLMRFAEDNREASRIDIRYDNTLTWINATVESQILRNAQINLVVQGKTTIQDLLREPKDQLAPTELSTITMARRNTGKAAAREKDTTA
ncbi:hypothetical protein DL765_005668 [Monosporascus sp. GIB2]|nr:hypothetical protein DL765_005668 [Monosporascus sp. GIB2]